MDKIGGLCEISGGHPRTLSVHEFFEFIKWHPRVTGLTLSREAAKLLCSLCSQFLYRL